MINELANRLPDTIIDNHIHIWPKECISIKKSEYAIYKTYKPWTDFDYMEEFVYEDFRSCVDHVFPTKNYFGLFFGLPFPLINIEKNNKYVAKIANEYNSGFFYIPGQFENIFDTDEKPSFVKSKRIHGIQTLSRFG